MAQCNRDVTPLLMLRLLCSKPSIYHPDLSIACPSQMLPYEGEAEQESADTGLGDSHPDMALLYQNHKMFYHNLIVSMAGRLHDTVQMF